MQCVIVSDAKTPYLKGLTEQAIITSGVECIIVEKQPINYENAITVHYSFDFNYNKCLNLGYRHTADNVCFANNDVIFGYNWQECEPYLLKYGSLSLLNPGWGFHANYIPPNVYEGYNTGRELCGWALIVSRETMEKTGGFDEDVKFWTSDDIWRTQLQYHGIQHALITEYAIKHLTSKTLASGLPRDKIFEYTHGQAREIEKAMRKYVKKHN